MISGFLQDLHTTLLLFPSTHSASALRPSATTTTPAAHPATTAAQTSCAHQSTVPANKRTSPTSTSSMPLHHVPAIMPATGALVCSIHARPPHSGSHRPPWLTVPVWPETAVSVF
jgi:hypothetical protein